MAILNEGTTIGGKTILDIVYPVGSIYITESDSFDPNVSFTGQWDKIQDRFLYGTGSENSVSGSIGGEKSHTLTEDEMPSHRHVIIKWASGNGSDFSGGKIASAASNGASLGGNEIAYSNHSGRVNLTTTCHHITQSIFGEEFHRFNPSFKYKSIILKEGIRIG